MRNQLSAAQAEQAARRFRSFGERKLRFLSVSCASWRLRSACGVEAEACWTWMARAAAVVAVLAVGLLLACLPPAAASSSQAAPASRRLERTAMDTAPGVREKADVTKGAEEDVSTTGFGAESEREVPTGPDPIHHHGRGPRRQSP